MMTVLQGTLASIVDFLLFCRQEGLDSTIFLTDLLNGIFLICQTIQSFDKTVGELALLSISYVLALKIENRYQLC